MSFQLSVATAPPLPRPALITPVGPSPVAAVPLTKGIKAGLQVTTSEDYDTLSGEYQTQIARYQSTDEVSINWRKRLDTQASILRAQFESIGIKLHQLEDEYAVLAKHDGQTHDIREMSYDRLVEKYNGLKPEDREGRYRPPYPIESRVNANDTSQKFRDANGALTGPITEQTSDRSPDWLATLTDVVDAVTMGWKAGSANELEAVPATNDTQRSRHALARAVQSHSQVHMSATWKPAVMLAPGETIQKNVQCAYDWHDMYDPEATISAPVVKPVAVRASPPSIERTSTPVPLEPLRSESPYPVEKPLGTEGLERLSLSALTEIGNRVEAELRSATIKQVGANSTADVGARAQRLAGVTAVGGAIPWYKR
jgi:hypothetical protein